MKKKISIIIPYYKKLSFFKKTIDTIKNQSFKNYEVIIIYDDDDKKDLKFVKSLIKCNKKFKLFVNKKNLGAGKSRNIGINLSRGEYISFLDSDDLWLRNKLKDQYKFMSNNNYDFSHTSYSIINDKGLKIQNRYAKQITLYSDLLKSCDIGLSTVMIKKQCLKKLKFPNLKTKEDYVLWLKIAKKKIKLFGLNKTLVLWRKTSNSLSANTLQKIKDSFLVYYKYEKQNFITTAFYVLRLSFNYILKKNGFR